MTNITKGAVVKCQANGNMEHDFIGTVTKCYENSCLVQIDEFDPKDRMNARELLHMTVIANRRMEVLVPGQPEPATAPIISAS
ncbi:hypothetical protein [Lacticaseibacillus parakribbianus]|uniref:hypothetical protein n=1 Tax=Lacticaseibacillus parakribbianus TaxID=2970927 RepID=UPI0021CB0E2D|nr:hypothetical protein [Lacticaseibacillus parakribbianus]